MTDISRRQALTALGTVSLSALLAACGGDDTVTSTVVSTADGGSATVAPQSPSGSGGIFDGAASCTLTVEQTEGPFYFDVDSIRSDIRDDRQGARLRLAMRVQDAEGCTPISDAVVEVWHCDAEGLYSGFESASLGGAAGSGRTDEETYLRGAQVTGNEGIVRFTTIYPGWYPGRTAHIHFKVHVDGSSTLTSQLYFDEAVSEAVYANPPYLTGRNTFNDSDGIFDPSTTLTVTEDGDEHLGVITIGVLA